MSRRRSAPTCDHLCCRASCASRQHAAGRRASRSDRCVQSSACHRLAAIVISVGTGGTISGVGRFFKERKPEVLIVGADPEGSVYTAHDEGDVHPYLVEGIGKASWPKTMDPPAVA